MILFFVSVNGSRVGYTSSSFSCFFWRHCTCVSKKSISKKENFNTSSFFFVGFESLLPGTSVFLIAGGGWLINKKSQRNNDESLTHVMTTTNKKSVEFWFLIIYLLVWNKKAGSCVWLDLFYICAIGCKISRLIKVCRIHKISLTEINPKNKLVFIILVM